jgi:hypothetical protein
MLTLNYSRHSYGLTTLAYGAKTRLRKELCSRIVRIRHYPPGINLHTSSAARVMNVFSYFASSVLATFARIKRRAVGRKNVACVGTKEGLNRSTGGASAGRESSVRAGIEDFRRANRPLTCTVLSDCVSRSIAVALLFALHGEQGSWRPTLPIK